MVNSGKEQAYLGELVEQEVDREPGEESLLHRIHDFDEGILRPEPGGSEHLFHLAYD